MSLPVAVLAGGLATRLRPITEKIPKILIEVAGRPFAEHQLELLRRNGLECVVFCVGHLGKMVEAALGDGSRFEMDLRYSYDGPGLLGTGGALRRALPLLGEAFFVLYGDAYLECDYAAVERTFRESGKPGLMTVYRNEGQWDSSNVVYCNGRVLRYDKKDRSPDMRHIDYGLGALKAQFLEEYPPGISIDLATIYRDMLSRDQLAAFEVDRRFYEIGSPEGLEATRRHLSTIGKAVEG